MLRRVIFICTLLIPLSHAAAQVQPAAEGVRVEVVATASEYIPRSATISHPGHSYTNCLGSTSFFGQFQSYGDFGSFSGTADTSTHCSTTFSPPSETTLTTYRRVNYTIARGDHALFLLSCTQTWKPNAMERARIGFLRGLEAGSGKNSGAADRAEANAKGEWSECPAFAIGSTYTLTVRNTSDVRLEGTAGGKPTKLDYLSSAVLPQPPAQVVSTKPGEARVHITSLPSGGEIYVDGKFFGNTPSDITVPAGEHLFKVMIGSKEWSRSVQITAGEIRVHANLAEN